MTLELENTTVSIHKGKLPNLPFLELKEDILGKDFDLSLSLYQKKKLKI
jgi:hypothetical protein